MDNVFHFKSDQPIVRPKGSLNQQYFSDVEGEDASSTSASNTTVKKSTFSSNFKLEVGYATDDTNSDSESSKLKVTSKSSYGKASKFKNQTTQQPTGDEGLNDLEEGQEDLQSTAASTTTTIRTKEKKASAILMNARKEVASLADKIPLIGSAKDSKIKSVLSHSRQPDSDADVKKITAKNQIIDTLKSHPFRHLIFASSIREDSFKKHLSLTYRGLIYASKCLKGPSEQYIKSKQVDVVRPKHSKGKTLLLDLDETLIHSCTIKENPDHVITAKSEKGETSQIFLKIRPYCMDFLQKLTQFWDIYVFTASSPCYAEAIVNYLDPNRKYINGILNRLNCMETKNGFFIKDLRIVKDADLVSTILVDNLSHSFGFQPENGVPILEWHNDKQDHELKHLMSYLIQAAQSPDVREFNRQYLKLHQLIEMKSEELGI